MTEPRSDRLQPGGTRPGSVVVIGTGLIGTSVALALRERDITVWLADHDDEAVRLAANLGAGRRSRRRACLAARPTWQSSPSRQRRSPPSSAPLRSAAWRALTPTSPASRSYRWPAPASWAATWPATCPATRCPAASGPGPAAARADLFVGRPWVLCPQPANDETTIMLVTGLAQACGALPVAVISGRARPVGGAGVARAARRGGRDGGPA